MSKEVGRLISDLLASSTPKFLSLSNVYNAYIHIIILKGVKLNSRIFPVTLLRCGFRVFSEKIYSYQVKIIY